MPLIEKYAYEYDFPWKGGVYEMSKGYSAACSFNTQTVSNDIHVETMVNTCIYSGLFYF